MASTRAFPLGVLTAVTGVSGSGKSSLVEPGAGRTGRCCTSATSPRTSDEDDAGRADDDRRRHHGRTSPATRRRAAPGAGGPEADRPHPALQPGHLHRPVRPRPQAVRGHAGSAARAASTPGASPSTSPRAAARPAKARASSASSCCSCPASTRPCPTCHGARYNAETLRSHWQRHATSRRCCGMTVDEAGEFFADEPPIARPCSCCSEIGLGYLRLGQPATELSGGEAQRIKLATELQRSQRGRTPLHAGRADDRPAPRRRRTADGAAARAGGCREHGDRGRARHPRSSAASDWIIEGRPGCGRVPAGESSGRVRRGSREGSVLPRVGRESRSSRRQSLSSPSAVVGRYLQGSSLYQEGLSENTGCAR